MSTVTASKPATNKRASRKTGVNPNTANKTGLAGVTLRLRRHWLWIVANLAAAFPLLWLAWDTLMGNLTVNPIDDFTERTGKAAIILLLASLAVTPIQTITGWRQVGTIRKSLGLWAFTYISLHLLVFVGLDYAFSLRFILQDGLPQKPYIVVGFLAFLVLLPLAITSTRGWMKRLGKNWKRLHRAVYAAGVLAVFHYLWVSKVAWGEPVVYAGLLVLLLAARIPWVRGHLSKLRRYMPGAKPQAQPRPKPKLASEA
jgi:sulfoxide reductase heme-binding subunit YedZ